MWRSPRRTPLEGCGPALHLVPLYTYWRTALARLAGAVVAGAAGKDGGPDGEIGWLLASAEEEDAVGREEAVDAGEKSAPRLLREVEHDVAEKDKVEAVGGAGKGKRWAAEVGLAEVAEPADLRLDDPVLAYVVEVTDDEAGGQAAVNLDTVITARLGTFDDLTVDVSAFDDEVPGG